MKKKNKKSQVFHSLMEVEKKYFPKAFEKKMAQKPEDARAMGTQAAKESLKRIAEQLAK